MRRNGNEQQQMFLLWNNYGTVITDRNRISQRARILSASLQEFSKRLSIMNTFFQHQEKGMKGKTILYQDLEDCEWKRDWRRECFSSSLRIGDHYMLSVLWLSLFLLPVLLCQLATHYCCWITKVVREYSSKQNVNERQK